jgi:CBS domain containing-hemolysin-like protein
MTLKHVGFVGILLDVITISALSLFAIAISFSLKVIWSFLVLSAALIIIFILLPRTRPSDAGKKLAELLARPLAYLLRRLERPVTKLENTAAKVNRRLHKAEPLSKNALSELLKEQEKIAGEEMKADLQLASSGLQLNSQKTSYHMVRTQKARFVNVDDEVGPILLSELHDTGRKIFPAMGEDSEIAGTVRLDNLIELKSGGKVSSALNPQIIVINKNEPVLTAIKRFIESAPELMFVEADDGKPIGVIYLEDVLKTFFDNDSTN